MILAHLLIGLMLDETCDISIDKKNSYLCQICQLC